MGDAVGSLREFDPFPPQGASARERALRYLVLDVFTQTPLQGNPVAVFTDAAELQGARMQEIARELNLSESVFLSSPRLEGDVGARIFTPTTELPFAGHPVLGSAVVVAGALGRESVTLETGGGPVTVEIGAAQGRATFGRMQQPLPTWEPFEAAGELLRALSLTGSSLPVEVYRNGPRQVYVALESEQEVAALRPDLAALCLLGALCVSCFAAEGARVRSRMFAPGLGVPEDPATGSAAGPLAVHLARHGRIAFGQEIEISQGAEIGRPSQLFARALGSGERLERVEVGGWSVIVGVGELRA